MATHSVTQDKAERYLLAANDDLAAAHRLLQTSRVGMRRALRWVLSSQCQCLACRPALVGVWLLVCGAATNI